MTCFMIRGLRFADGDFDTFFECFLAGEVDFGDYFDHLVPWVEAAARPNVLLVQYESLRADPRAGIAAVAGFLGVDVSQPAPAANRDFLEWVVDESSIGSMRRNQSRWSSERPTALPFVRRGSVGGWQSIFSGRQTRQLAERFRERTRGTAAAALWPDIMDAASQVRGPAQQ